MYELPLKKRWIGGGDIEINLGGLKTAGLCGLGCRWEFLLFLI